MRAAIMQPYFFPYIGYFQLIKAADNFVIYDNIQFTKKGWINRNRILVNGKDEYLTVPLKKDSDFLHVNERRLAEDFDTESIKILRKLEGAYRKAPYFNEVFPLLKGIIEFPEKNLFGYIFNSLVQICSYTGIDTKFIISSGIKADHSLRGQDKVIAICKALNATEYINAIGGIDLYDKAAFAKEDINLEFIRCGEITYPQFNNEFAANLSIIDVLMFNNREQTNNLLSSYSII